MRNKQPSDPSKTGLPVPAASTGALPVLTEHAQLDANLTPLLRVLKYPFPCAEERVSCLKAALPFIDKWRADWRALDQPATTDEIATEMLRLTTTMPNAGNIDQGMLADTLCQDISELRPTAWALERGCRAHRGESEFLSFAKLEEQIRHAERRAEHFRALLERDDFAEELKKAEDSLQDERRQEAEFERLRKLDEKRLAESERRGKLTEKRRAEEERKAIENPHWFRDKLREFAGPRQLRDHKHSDAPDE